jgi:hypothetical protein
MRNSGVVGSYITPKFPTILQCTVPLYITYIGNIVSRLSLTAFLLWRIRQIDMESKVWDKRICILLFVIRAAFTVNFLLKYDIFLPFSFKKNNIDINNLIL